MAQKQWSQPPAMQIDPNKTYIATMNTSEGTIKIELDPKDAPNTVNNFVFLSREGFYNGVKFHRIVKGFMIQGGDPTGTGGGGPGYRFADELPKRPDLDYTPGVIAMANAGPNTQGSQFFIMHGDYSKGKLQKNYTIFGKVVDGMDVVNKIADTPVTRSRGGENSQPTRDVTINSITIEER